MTQAELGRRAGMKRQNLGNKLLRDNFTAQELEKICTILDLKLIAQSKDGTEYKIEYEA